MQRKFKTKDVDMLITAATILESAIAQKTVLQSKRSTWTDDYFNSLKNRIDLAVQNHLGIDSAKDLRLATKSILSIQNKAIRELAEVKVQITEDFKNETDRLSEILTQLGFAAFHKEVQNRDQEALINLLFRFKTNLTEALKEEIVAKGTAPQILDNITAHADALKSADITQEAFKGSRKIITETSLQEFNEIYDQVISISKIGAKFFKDQPAIKDQFSFRKVSKTLNFKPKSIE